MVFIHSLKDILSVKVKARHDGFCDQLNRMFMTKLLLIMSIIMSFDYFADQISCIVGKESATNLEKDFIHSACWISGLYIYKEMKTRPKESIYYGIASDIHKEGLDASGNLCSLITNQNHRNPNCHEMTRVYYLQYQWMPFYIGACAVFYYMPYMLFRIINTDIISLRTAIKSSGFSDTDGIIKNYFDLTMNPLFHQRLRVWWNIFVKALYVFISVSVFYMTDYLLLGNYVTYGIDYLTWARNSSAQHNGVRLNQRPKAGNVLLPSMGFCDVYEGTKDLYRFSQNTHKCICEISPNILYQYILMVLWFFFLTSIAVSMLGMVMHCTYLLYHLTFYRTQLLGKDLDLYAILTLREVEYLDAIKQKSMILYGEVSRKLRKQKLHHIDNNNNIIMKKECKNHEDFKWKANGVQLNYDPESQQSGQYANGSVPM